MNKERNNPEDIANELLNGNGFTVLPQVFQKKEIEEARGLVLHYSENEKNKETHFHGANNDKLSLQKRVWNLLNKGDIFIRMVENPTLNGIVAKFLGEDFHIGSIAANRIMAGGPGQEPHIDCPYWDMYNENSFPMGINYTVPMNCQTVIMLDDFTIENGGTAIVAHSQKKNSYPKEKEFFEKMQQITGKAGDVAIFYGMCWHCAMPNKSPYDRSAILIQYLPKFVIPMEDQKKGVSEDVLNKSSDQLKKLLGFHYPYPKLMDHEVGVNRIGRNTE